MIYLLSGLAGLIIGIICGHLKVSSTTTFVISFAAGILLAALMG